jgi:hypothetical protein
VSASASASATATAPVSTSTTAPHGHTPLTSLSVVELRQLLKEKYKHHPEKHTEIQKLKKVELIYALQNM